MHIDFEMIFKHESYLDNAYRRYSIYTDNLWPIKLYMHNIKLIKFDKLVYALHIPTYQINLILQKYIYLHDNHSVQR